MSNPICLTLSGAVLPQNSDLTRDHVRKPARQSPHYLDRYDQHTLFYDCVYHAENGTYLFTAPRFLNLWPEFRDRLRLDGAPVPGMARRKSGKYEQVILKAPPGEVSLDWPGGGWSIPSRPDIADRFAGLNSVVTLNKDNDLSWIRDWLAYLIRKHDLQAAVIFDNGSTAYSQQDLAQAAADTGLAAVAIISADYPYGPRDSGKGMEIRPKFLQPALLNLARTDILRHARAVLNVDIDEIVMRRSGPNVFDRAVSSWAGAIHLPGLWAYPSPNDPVPIGHGAHLWRAGAKEKKSNPKWCAVPSGRISKLGWFVHHVGGEAFRFLPPVPDCEFVHCRGTSTGWKGSRFKLPNPLSKDPELESLMQSLPAQEEKAT